MDGMDVTPGRNIMVRQALDSQACAKSCLVCQGCVAVVYDSGTSQCFLKDNTNLEPSANSNLLASVLQI
jgi:hypothetical protein